MKDTAKPNRMKGVLLVNLGSPDSTSTKDVKKYLDEFLMDKRVIDTPYLLRAFVVKGIILRTRPKQSAEAYKKIWWKEGSPLVVLSQRLQNKLQNLSNIPIGLGMRYGRPSLKQGMQELVDQGVEDVLLLPLYPQHAMSSAETVEVLAEKLRKKHFKHLKITKIPAFYDNPDYINVLANSIEVYLKVNKWDHLLFSYHGLPERHIHHYHNAKRELKIDEDCCSTASEARKFCYRHQCFETTRLVVEKLGLEKDKYSISFQSRLGKDPWIKPYTDIVINEMAEAGTKNLAVVTPAFVSDCLETLEEIGMEAKEQFLHHGGENFTRIPCLNDREDWVEVLGTWIKTWKETEQLPK